MNPHVSSVHCKGQAKVYWLELPDDIVYNIADKFTRQRDLIHFGTVCHSWRSIYTDILKCRTRRLPLLMLATDLNQDDQTRSFYNISDKIVCNSQVHVPQNRHCPGSSHGWVATVTPDLKVSLINIFNREDNEISLPPLQAFEQNIDIYYHPGFLHKIILSTNPASDPNYVILAIHGAASWLAYYKPGDKAWTSLDSKYHLIDDAIFYRDQFYVATIDGEVYAIDLDCIEPRVTTIAPATPTQLHKRYLVDSSGDLLQIVRFTEPGKRGEICDDTDDMPVSYHNDGFDVFKWDPIELKWIELTNLGDRVFFVGDNASLCVSATAYPKCLPNSIYYTDDYHEGYYDNEEYGIGPHDMGVFSFDDGRNRPHYPATSEIINPPPIWIEPPI